MKPASRSRLSKLVATLFQGQRIVGASNTKAGSIVLATSYLLVLLQPGAAHAVGVGTQFNLVAPSGSAFVYKGIRCDNGILAPTEGEAAAATAKRNYDFGCGYSYFPIADWAVKENPVYGACGSTNTHPAFTVYDPEIRGYWGSEIYESSNAKHYIIDFWFRIDDPIEERCKYQARDGFVVLRYKNWACPAGTHFYDEMCRYRSNKPEKEKSCERKGIGNPVMPGSGLKVQMETDGGFPDSSLTIQRTYRSNIVGSFAQDLEWAPNSRPGSAVGKGWMLNLSPWLDVSRGPNVTSVHVHNPDGSTIVFNGATGLWESDSDINDVLQDLQGTDGLAGWRLTRTHENRIETYDAAGRLVSSHYAGGGWARNELDADLRLLKTSNQHGRSLNFSYDANGYIDAITTGQGEVFLYSYDDRHNLTAVTYPDGAQRRYHYDRVALAYGNENHHGLTGITDENGVRFATYAYDDQGRAISTGHANGADQYTLSYDSDGSTLVTDPLGTARRYEFQSILGVFKNTGLSQSCTNCTSSAKAYDPNGNLASQTDFNGAVTTYTYDLTRNLETRRTEASGTPQARTITTAWHPDWRLEAQRAEPLKITTWVYNGQPDPTASGAIAACAPSDALLPDGKPISVLCKKSEQATADANGSRGFSATLKGSARTWNYTWNAHGQILSATDPRGSVTTYAYDLQGNLTHITNPLGQVTRIISHDSHGRPLTIIAPDLTATQYRYDARGRLTRKAVEQDVTTYTYDPVGQLIQLTQPDGSSLSYTYDPAHRLTQIQDSAGNRTVYTLDNAGNRIKEDTYDPSGQLARTRAQAFDALGRLAQALDSHNHATTYGYDANGKLTSSTDANGATTSHSYDPLGRLIQTLTPDNGQTSHSYDALDHLASVTDPVGITTTYTTDGLDNLTQESSPDSGTTKHTWDAAGNLLTSTSPTGIKLTYTHDPLNRLTDIKRGTTVQVTYAWDTPPGKLAGFTDLSGSTAYQYDPQGRLASKTQTQGTLAQTLSYLWQPGPLLAQMTMPSGNVLAYAYAQGKPVSLTLNGQPLLNNITHDPDGRITGWTWPNGLTHARLFGLDGEFQFINSALNTTYSYDPAGQLTGQHHWNQTHPAQNDTQTTWTLDAAGRLTGMQQTETPPTGAPLTDTLIYGYDLNGNRQQLGWNGIQTSYAYSGNRITQSTGAMNQAYTFDAAGRLTADNLYTYSYNALGRLASVKQGTTTVASYKYNALGQRVKKTGQGGNVRFVYDEAGHLVGEYTSTGKLVQEIVWLGDLPVASIRPKVKSTAMDVYAIHPDHLGTPRQITDSLNRIVWRWDTRDAFGSELPNEDADGDGKLFSFNLRFPGQYFDRETGRHYNYFRDYDPGTGRYTTSDPIGLDGGMNRFAYVEGNPIGFIDPNGLEKDKYQKPQNPNKRPPPDHRRPGGERERNVGHPDAEEHSIKPKGPRTPRNGRGARCTPLFVYDLIDQLCEDGVIDACFVRGQASYD